MGSTSKKINGVAKKEDIRGKVGLENTKTANTKNKNCY